MYLKTYHIYFVGIGGIGMSGIAELLLNLGYKVSGSDIRTSDITRRLERLGGTIYNGHAAHQIMGADVIVTSSAISPNNPEVTAAKKAAIPVIPRAEMLAELMRIKYSIAVAGAHGKTTTTSLVAAVLAQGGLDPTVVIGGKLKSIDTNAVLGSGEYIVAEADESDGSFLKFSPAIAVVTNIDREHLDYYKDIDAIKQVFLDFIHRIPFYGLAVLCLDNEAIQDLLPLVKKRFTTYGLNSQADLQAQQVVHKGPTSHFTVIHRGQPVGEINLNLPGTHNVQNALAGIAVGLELNIPFAIIKAALETVTGVRRRMEIKGDKTGITIMDDYGHHPTEIKSTLNAIRQSWPHKRLVVVFQPHRHTRTAALFDEFTRAFYQSDAVVVLPIYAAGEEPIPGVEAARLFESIRDHGHKDVSYFEEPSAAVVYLIKTLKQGDILLTLGAGDVWKLGEQLLQQLPSENE